MRHKVQVHYANKRGQQQIQVKTNSRPANKQINTHTQSHTHHAPTRAAEIVKCHLQRLHKNKSETINNKTHTKTADQIQQERKIQATTTAEATTTKVTMLNNYYLMAFALPRLTELS